MNGPRTVFDFSIPEHQQPWQSIDDRIMGGCSQSQTEVTATNSLLFSGEVSLENNGGFASVRSPADRYDLSGCGAIVLRVKGDGKRYKLGLRIDVYYDGVTYFNEFETAAGQWEEVRLPFDAFVPTHHGQALTNAAALDLAEVKSFVLLISGRQEGPFRMELDCIKTA